MTDMDICASRYDGGEADFRTDLQIILLCIWNDIQGDLGAFPGLHAMLPDQNPSTLGSLDKLKGAKAQRLGRDVLRSTESTQDFRRGHYLTDAVFV